MELRQEAIQALDVVLRHNASQAWFETFSEFFIFKIYHKYENFMLEFKNFYRSKSNIFCIYLFEPIY